MPPTHNRKTKAEPRARSQHRSLSKLFEEPDLLQLVLSRLSAEQLCLCSMVCSRMKSTIDTCLPLLQQFARDLRWWGTPFPHESVSLCFDTDKGHYSQEVQHTESARQISESASRFRDFSRATLDAQKQAAGAVDDFEATARRMQEGAARFKLKT